MIIDSPSVWKNGDEAFDETWAYSASVVYLSADEPRNFYAQLQATYTANRRHIVGAVRSRALSTVLCRGERVEERVISSAARSCMLSTDLKTASLPDLCET